MNYFMDEDTSYSAPPNSPIGQGSVYSFKILDFQRELTNLGMEKRSIKKMVKKRWSESTAASDDLDSCMKLTLLNVTDVELLIDLGNTIIPKTGVLANITLSNTDDHKMTYNWQHTIKSNNEKIVLPNFMDQGFIGITTYFKVKVSSSIFDSSGICALEYDETY